MYYQYIFACLDKQKEKLIKKKYERKYIWSTEKEYNCNDLDILINIVNILYL